MGLWDGGIRGRVLRARILSRSRLPSARLVAGRARGRHCDLLRRQDRRWPGDRDRHPADDVRRARPRLRSGDGGHGPDRHDRGSGRLGGFGCDRARRHGRAPDRGRGPARAAGDGVGALRRARGGAQRERGRDFAARRSHADGHLRRADRRRALRCRADRGQHQRDHRCREHQAGAGPEVGRPVDPALRHPGEGGCVARVGRRRDAPGDGACPECAPAFRGGRRSRPSTSRRCATCPASSAW